LIGGGVGYPSIGAMLRQILEDNLLEHEYQERKQVCFMWTFSKVDQLHLCFPSLLADLARYVHRSSLADLQKWLTVKIFVGAVKPDDVLNVKLDRVVAHAIPHAVLDQVLAWLLNSELGGDAQGAIDEDGTYIAQGSLGAGFADILRCSLFTKEKVVEEERSLGICFCGPLELCNWLKEDYENTALPYKSEFASECVGG